MRNLAETDSHFVIWGPVVENQPGHYVCCDNALGARLATEHLIRQGRKRIAFAGAATAGSPEFQLRHQGFAEVLEAAGLAPLPQLHTEAQSLEVEGYRSGIELIDAGMPFDAVFAASDLIAMGVIHALQDRGVSVPQDVAVVGFDDIASAADFNPALTTIRQDTHLRGRDAGREPHPPDRGPGHRVQPDRAANSWCARPAAGAQPPEAAASAAIARSSSARSAGSSVLRDFCSTRTPCAGTSIASGSPRRTATFLPLAASRHWPGCSHRGSDIEARAHRPC